MAKKRSPKRSATKGAKKRLYRSKDNRVLTGLIGGLGDYFSVDPVILRLGFVLITVFTEFFAGVIVYIIGSVIVPEKK